MSLLHCVRLFLFMFPGLSVSELGSLLTMVLTCITFIPAFISADLPFENLAIAYLVSGMPHFALTRVSSCITAMITLERCLSVVVPLKVRVSLNSYGSTIIVILYKCTMMMLTVLVKYIRTYRNPQDKIIIGRPTTHGDRNRVKDKRQGSI